MYRSALALVLSSAPLWAEESPEPPPPCAETTAYSQAMRLKGFFPLSSAMGWTEVGINFVETFVNEKTKHWVMVEIEKKDGVETSCPLRYGLFYESF